MTRVAILWHMHQPSYQDIATGEHILPWVRLHGLKDYYGMVALLREFPGVRLTFNLVPSLLVQLEAFAREEARDRHLEIGLKPAESLRDDERAFCVQHFFHAYRPRMIDPYPRYVELLTKRGQQGSGLTARSQASHFTTQDLRDLQVWHKLAWLDPIYLAEDPRVRGLVSKDRGFSEDDKEVLRAVELELLRKVIPEYRAASGRGQIELSTSPFYHPILPLLCDTDVYLRAHPHSRMPRERFQHPEDAVEQLSRAVALHERLFGQRPAGLWPSEGSVSDAMVPIVAAAGFEWMATDEEILARSIGSPFTRDGRGHLEQPERLYKPYAVGAPRVGCAFRDHVLSDLIGFTYTSWSADVAADDFVTRLVEGGRRYTEKTGREATIPVILDGENAWEYYEGGGRPFLRAVYRRLEHHEELRTVTMAEACQAPEDVLPSIFPGSWINGDFYIWLGHEDDRRAWSQLAGARRTFDLAAPTAPPAAVARAHEELLIAEGSDWFWWYGDDHSSEHDLEFDDLFRRHVRNVYRALEKPVPEELFVTNITTAPPDVAISAPTALIAPVIDGEVTSYFEWVGAGCVEVRGAAGAMHQVADVGAGLSLVEFGFDLARLYIRMDSSERMDRLLEGGYELEVKFVTPARLSVVIDLASGRPGARLLDRLDDGSQRVLAGDGFESGIGTVAEIAVPFHCLRLEPRDGVAFVVTLRRGEVELEHHPGHRAIELRVPDGDFGAAHWTV